MKIIAKTLVSDLLRPEPPKRGFLQPAESHEGHVKLHRIVQCLRKTPTGAQLLDHAAACRVKIAAANDCPQPLYGEKIVDVVALDGEGDVPMMATVLGHELDHVLQVINMSRIGLPNDPRLFPAIADTVYPMIIREGGAYSTQALIAKELADNGEPSTLQYMSVDMPYRDMYAELMNPANKGRAEQHGRLFDVWMKGSLFRDAYDAKFMVDIAAKPYGFSHMQQSGTSLSNAMLGAIVQPIDADNAYADQRDLTSADYLGVWKNIRGYSDFEQRQAGLQYTKQARVYLAKLNGQIDYVKHITAARAAGEKPHPDIVRIAGATSQIAAENLKKMTTETASVIFATLQNAAEEAQAVVKIHGIVSKATTVDYGDAWNGTAALLKRSFSKKSTLRDAVLAYTVT